MVYNKMFKIRVLLQFSKCLTNTGSLKIPQVTKVGKFSSWTQKTDYLCGATLFKNCNVRTYAKGKDKKKEKGKTKVAIDENQLSEVINVETLKTQLEKAVFGLEEDFVKNLSLRSTAGAIESIPVTVDGTTHSLQEIAQIVRKNPKMVVINMSAFPQYIPDVVKAIGKSGMNLNPQQDGTSLFVPIPKVTKEHREGLSKSAKQLFTRSRDTIKDIQIKYVKQIKKKEKISEDLVRSVEQQIIAIADSYIQEAEKLLLRKQEELLGKD